MRAAADPDSESLARRPAALTAVIAAVAFAALATFLVPWDWIPGGDLVPATPSEVFTPAEIDRAEAYSSTRRYLGWSSYLVSLLVALALGFTLWGARLLARLVGGLRWWLAVPAGALVLVLIGQLATLPFAMAIHNLGLDYGLTNQAWGDWALDSLRSLLVSVVLMSVVLLVIVGAARFSPRYWFVWGSGAAVVVTAGVSFLYPVVVEPFFNDFTSMHAGPFKSSVFELAKSEGVDIDDVLVSDASRRTTTLNAYVSGFGSTRRVVVYDNLLDDLTPDEARVAIAHELAHAKHEDVLLGTALGGVGSIFAVSILSLLLDFTWLQLRSGTQGPSDPRALALILALAVAGTLLASPIQSTISRAIEARADRDSIAVAREGSVFGEMQHKLAIHSLSDPTPPMLSQFWFGSHPTVLERVGMPASLTEASK